MTDETKNDIPTKWEYIASQLKLHGAPIKVINAAHSIDQAMTDLKINEHTETWIVSGQYNRSCHLECLRNLIPSRRTCNACVDAENLCANCKLGHYSGCTPRFKHADNYYLIVRRWVIQKHIKSME